ncbi:MAG: AtpZ/AtpI family protein [Planctomycetota bacterium]|jgi:ATP synthase protein I
MEEPRRGRFAQEVEDEVERKLEAERKEPSLLQTVGLVGAVGWMVALPAVLGAWLGQWLDAESGRLTWTLALLLLGVGLGAYTAWTRLFSE